MRIKDYGLYLEYYQVNEKYRVDFYKHNKLTHSIEILPCDVVTLASAFSKYDVRKCKDNGFDFRIDSNANLIFVDASHNTIGLGTVAPSVPFKII